MKKTSTILISLLWFSISLNAQNPQFEWAASFFGQDYISDEGTSICFDEMGNVFLTGNFSGTVDFDPGSGTYNLTSNGSNDIFIIKLTASKEFVWAKRIGGSNSDGGNSICFQELGFIYVTGFFYGSVDFDPGNASCILSAGSGPDVFLLKMNLFGDLIWAKNFGGNYWQGENSNSIAVDNAGNVYITGWFNDTIDFDPSPGELFLSSHGNEDAFICKFNSGGDIQWARKFGGIQRDNGYSLTLDTNCNIYTTGFFKETADFDPSVDTFNLTSNGGFDVFICKLDSAGEFVWAQSMGGPDDDWGYSIECDKGGNSVVTGKFRDTISFNAGASQYNLSSNGEDDIFIAKIDSGGSWSWIKGIGGSQNDGGSSISLDLSNSVYATGYFKGVVDFDTGINVSNCNSHGNNDVFVVKYSGEGEFDWAKCFGGTHAEIGKEVKVFYNDLIYLTGFFNQTVDFNPDTGVFELTSGSSSNTFLLKLSQLQSLSANFSVSDTTITLGDTIQFTDLSTGNSTSWLWNFGDGTSNTIQNPIHIYQSPGNYSVTLIVSDSTSSDTLTKSNYITINLPPSFTCGVSNVSDYDGNTYNTVLVGNQCWMKENLRTTHYANGLNIPLIANQGVWASLQDNSTDDAYCWYNDDSTSYANIFGALYTWAAAMGDNEVSSNTNPSGIQGACPDGWHLPSDDEWKELEMQLGMNQNEVDSTGWRGTNEGSKLAGSSLLWNDGNLENNAQFQTSGFSALPGGCRYFSSGAFYYLNSDGFWWSSTEGSVAGGWSRTLNYNDVKVYRYAHNFKSNGFSVRCLKDTENINLYNLNTNKTDASCFGSVDGEFNIIITGGLSPFKVDWWDGSSEVVNGTLTLFKNNLIAGIYGVTVMDASGWPASAQRNWYDEVTGQDHSLIIPANTPILIDGIQISNGDYISVFYDSLGISRSGAGGILIGNPLMGVGLNYQGLSNTYQLAARYNAVSSEFGFDNGETFQWKLWRSSDSILIPLTPVFSSNSPNVNYYVNSGISIIQSLSGSVWESYPGAVAIDSIVIGQPDSIYIESISYNPTCSSCTDGAISLDVTGGSSPYLFNWNNGQPTDSISGLSQGIYSLQLIDANECSKTDSFELVAAVNTSWTPCPGAPTVTDFDGNIYNTVFIGSQCWMKENLRATHYSDGLSIPKVTDNTAWSNLTYTDPAYCFYNNDTANASIYGALYTWRATMKVDTSSNDVSSGVQGICPLGWHVPSDEEWKILEGEADSQYGYPNQVWEGTGDRGYDAGLHLKSSSGWNNNINGDNIFDFTVLPSGTRIGNGSYVNSGNYSYFWTSTNNSYAGAWSRLLSYTNSQIGRFDANKNFGRSVRCLKDPESAIPLNWNYTPTGNSHYLIIPDTAQISMNGNPVATGDYLGVFYDSAGTWYCGGYVVWADTSTYFPAFGSQEGVYTGFEYGEEFTWMIWDQSEDSIFQVDATYIIQGFPNTNIYSAGGVSAIASLTTGEVNLSFGDYLSATSICAPYLSEFQMEVINHGANPVDSFAIAWSDTSGHSGNVSFNILILPGDTVSLVVPLTDTLFAPARIELNFELLAENESQPLDNHLVQDGISLSYPGLNSTIILPDCHFLNDGSILIQPQDFLGYASILWSTSDTSLFVDSLVPGIYSFTFSDENCLLSDTVILEQQPVLQQSVHFPAGWSLFSSYLNLEDSNLVDIFAPALNYVIVIRNSQGYVYWPFFGLNQIGNFTIGEGYQLNSNSPFWFMFESCAAVVPENTVITLPEGWSIMAYLRQNEMDVEVAISSIVADIKLIKDYNGNAFWPYFNLNMIGNFVPGQGYQIKMAQARTFSYPANSVNSSKAKPIIHLPQHFQKVRNTGSNMTLGIPLSSWQEIPQSGDEVGVFTESGLLVGSDVFAGGNMAITIWGDDETTPETDGLQHGEVFSLQAYKDISGYQNITGLVWIEGDNLYRSNKISVIGSLETIYQDKGILYQNQPNPFTFETEFSYYLPEKTKVEFTILNMLGEVVETLISEEMEAGKHSLKYQIKNLSAGSYYYRLKTCEDSKTRKMILLR